MKTLKLAEGLTLPLDVVTQTIAILAKRRAGKSYTMRRLVEQLFKAGQQVVLVDPKGDQWGIRSAADGKSPGLPIVILGGERGDVPLEVGSGEVVAKLVVEERVSALLDLSQFRKHELATFMTAFLENLYRLKAREQYRTPVMLVIDEADAVAPQKPPKGHERMLGAAEDIVRRGGQRGIGCVLVTQRSAVLNKNVLTQAQMLVVLRTIAPQDLKAMEAWVEVHGDAAQGRTLMASLPALPIGDAWFWSPGWPTAEGILTRAHVLPIETFDSGASPKPGVKPVEPKHLADVDLQALKGQMAATIEKAKADDPRELRKRIAELERELQTRIKGVLLTADTPAKAVEVLTDADREKIEAVRQLLWDLGEQTKKHLDESATYVRSVVESSVDQLLTQHAHRTMALVGKLEKAGFQRILEKLARVSSTTERQALISPSRPQLRVSPSINPALTRPGPTRDAAIALAKHVATAGDPTLKAMHLAMLTALAQHGALTRKKIRAYTGYADSGPVSSAFGLLVAQGYVVDQGGKLAITREGGVALGPYEPLPTGHALRERVLSGDRLSGMEKRFMAKLFEVYPASLTRKELRDACGYADSGPVSSAFGHLVAIDYAVDLGRAGLTAPAIFFEE